MPTAAASIRLVNDIALSAVSETHVRRVIGVRLKFFFGESTIRHLTRVSCRPGNHPRLSGRR